jgi:hypothetical protein
MASYSKCGQYYKKMSLPCLGQGRNFGITAGGYELVLANQYGMPDGHFGRKEKISGQ